MLIRISCSKSRPHWVTKKLKEPQKAVFMLGIVGVVFVIRVNLLWGVNMSGHLNTMHEKTGHCAGMQGLLLFL